MDRRRLTRIAIGALSVIALLALGLTAYFLADDAQTNVSRLGQWSPLLFSTAALAVLILLIAIIREAMRVVRQFRQRKPGARLAARLTLALVLLVIPPVILVYGFSLRFLSASIDSWFNVRVESALNDALELGHRFLDQRIEVARATTDVVAQQLQFAQDDEFQNELDDAIDSNNALQLALFTSEGNLLASSSADPRLLLPSAPDHEILLRLKSGVSDAATEPLGENLSLRIITQVRTGLVLQAVFALPQTVEPLAKNIEQSWHDYQRLKFLHSTLKFSFVFILTLVLLLSLLLALLAAVTVSRRLVKPIASLASATEKISAGDFSVNIADAPDDELGFLVKSFNAMAAELAATSARETQTRDELERQWRYLQTVLERLSSGVITVSDDGVLRSANRAASSILRMDVNASVEQPLVKLLQDNADIRPLLNLIAARVQEAAGDWRHEVTLQRDDTVQLLMVRGAVLRGSSHGHVVLIDDMSLINQTQRDAAWSEVARRLAHEIKNPLTPIQLAAERMRYKLKPHLPEAEALILEKATATIIAQVDTLKNMVNAFGDYARPPQLNLTAVDLNAMMNEMADLYEQDISLKIEKQLQANMPKVRADAGRLRQLMHNLIKNAIEAGDGDEKRITFNTTHTENSEFATLKVADSGSGLPQGFDQSWFEPYASTKARGTGLGLAIVKKIVDELGGEVSAHNRESGGAEFVVKLPVFD